MLLNNFTLLYVEDDDDARDVTSTILRPKVKELFIASNGEEGLELYKQHSPDIVITDIGMPLMNGLDMCKEIKSINYFQLILVITAFNDIATLRSTIDLGIDKYILKPLYDYNKLFSTLENMAKILQLDIDMRNSKRISEIENKIKSMSDMIGNIAHQWRQPLSVISTSVSGMQINLEYGIHIEDKQIDECANRVLKNTKYLSKIIDDFSYFFEDTSTTLTLFSIKDAIEHNIDKLKESFEENNIHIIKNITDIEYFQNEEQFTKSILNIFENVKDVFTLHSEIKDRYFFIDVSKSNNEIVLIFKDNGGGIAEAILNRLFEPYFTTKHKRVGAGISLYMTNQVIVNNFNGTILAQNEIYTYNKKEYKGAKFTIKLPLN
ncbi:MAG: hybrid sensor histidine kinase/response regulator [Campylobacterota bacterium]|nr:hybrid sensor histidine kinase/response regulator [Campylobacterota bacterium]